MKATKVVDKKPVLADVPEPRGEGVKVKLHRHPDISEALVTHRFPLDGVTEAFATAADRAAGAIKVVFDIA